MPEDTWRWILNINPRIGRLEPEIQINKNESLRYARVAQRTHKDLHSTCMR